MPKQIPLNPLDCSVPIKGGLIQFRERKIQSHDFQFPVTNINKDGADLGSENSQEKQRSSPF